jgi:hypothetical protein
LLDALEIQDPIQGWAEVPAAVEAITRSNGTEEYCFLLNFTAEPQRLNFKQPAFDLVGDRNLQGPEMIPGHGVLFVRIGSGA